MGLGQGGPRQGFDGDITVSQGLAALTGNGFALARYQGAQEVTERLITFVKPMELLTRAQQQALGAHQFRFHFSAKCGVER